MVGLFVVATIGVCVLVDLWDLMDIKRGLTMVSWLLNYGYSRILITLIETLYETLQRTRTMSDRIAHRRVPLLVLRPLCNSESIRTRRYIHELFVPRNVEEQCHQDEIIG